MSNLGQYVIPFQPDYHNWKRYVNPRTGFNSRSIPKMRFDTGFSVLLEPDMMEWPHIHTGIEEYLIFTGADLTNFFDEGFEIDLFLGDDPDHMEIYTITEPAVVRVPPNFWHCPINFKKIGKSGGINFMPVYLDTIWSKINRQVTKDGPQELSLDGYGIRLCVKGKQKFCDYCGECFSENAENRGEAGDSDFMSPYYDTADPLSGKFDKFVYKFKKEQHSLGDAILSPRANCHGDKAIPGSEISYSHNIVTKPVKIGDEPHFHDSSDEYLWFTGSNLLDIFGSFDAEIEVWLGDDPNHMEKFVIDKPTAIAIPPKVWHGPVNITRVGKPVNFMPWYMEGSWSKIAKKEIGDMAVLEYTGEGATKVDGPEGELYTFRD